MSIKARLKKFLLDNKINKLEFYKSIHVANGYLDKDSAVNSDVLAEIITTYPQLNIKWLLLGQGSMYIESKEDRIAKNYHVNTCDEKCQLKDYIIELQKDKITNLESKLHLVNKIPV